MVFKMDVKPNFTVENEAAISAPPKVDFTKPAASPAAPAGPATPAAPATPNAPKADAKGAAAGDPAADLLKKGY
jgi:LemA protein